MLRSSRGRDPPQSGRYTRRLNKYKSRIKGPPSAVFSFELTRQLDGVVKNGACVQGVEANLGKRFAPAVFRSELGVFYRTAYEVALVVIENEASDLRIEQKIPKSADTLHGWLIGLTQPVGFSAVSSQLSGQKS